MELQGFPCLILEAPLVRVVDGEFHLVCRVTGQLRAIIRDPHVAIEYVDNLSVAIREWHDGQADRVKRLRRERVG